MEEILQRIKEYFRQWRDRIGGNPRRETEEIKYNPIIVTQVGGNRIHTYKAVENEEPPFYLPILEDLGYNLEEARLRMEHCNSFGGDSGHFALKRIIKQVESQPHIYLNADVLILADRLYSVAIGLHYFMWKCTGIQARVVYNFREAMEAADERMPGFLVIAGYQRSESNYNIIHKLREREKPPRVVMWAAPDGYIHSICSQHDIYYISDRTQPVGEFIKCFQAGNA